MELTSHVEYISRSSGSIHETASYIARDQRVDERAGKTFNEPLHDGETHIATGMLYPAHFAPKDLDGNPRSVTAEQFWNWYEAREDELVRHRYRNSPEKIEQKLLKSILTQSCYMSLHNALSPETAERVVCDALGEVVTDRGFAVEWAIHDQKGNKHFHYQLTARPLTVDGVSSDKPIVGHISEQKAFTRALRESVARHQNVELAKLGIDDRVEHKSFADRGIKLAPKIHEGWYQRAMAREAEALSLRTGKSIDRTGVDKAVMMIEEGLPPLAIAKSGISRTDYNRAVEVYNSRLPARLIAESVINELTSTRATFTSAQFASLVFDKCGGDEQVLVDAQRFVLGGGAVHLGQDADGRDRFTSQKYRTDELTMFAASDDLMTRKSRFKFDIARLDANIEKKFKHLDAEQRNAVRTMVGERDLVIVDGKAGVGKTTMLIAAADEMLEAKCTIRGLAIAGGAAKKLEAESGIKSDTIAKWEYNEDQYTKLMAQVEKTGQMTAKQRQEYARLTEKRFQPGQVIVVDESGMVGTRQLAKMLVAARDVGARLILVGDHKQFAAIDAGDAFRGLIQHHTELVARVDDIKRQAKSEHADWMLPASKAFANDHITEGLKAYLDHGRIQFAANRTDARAALVDRVMADFDANIQIPVGKPEDGKFRRATQIAMAYTNADTAIMNKLIRAGMVQRGVVQAEGTEVNGKTFAIGDRIVFTKGQPAGGMVRDLGTVDQDHDWMALASDRQSRKEADRPTKKSNWAQEWERQRAESDKAWAKYHVRRQRTMMIIKGFVSGLDGVNRSLIGAAFRGFANIYYDAYKADLAGSKRKRAMSAELGKVIKDAPETLEKLRNREKKLEAELENLKRSYQVEPYKLAIKQEKIDEVKAKIAKEQVRLDRAREDRFKLLPWRRRRALLKAKALDEAERMQERRQSQGVENGTVSTIIARTDNCIIAVIDPLKEGDNARVVAFDPTAVNVYGNKVEFDHGYAVTFHKSQGQTQDLAYKLASKHERSDAAYVSFTRHAHDMVMFVDQEEFRDFDALARSMSRGPDKDLASDYQNEQYKEVMYLKDLNQSYAVQMRTVIDRAAEAGVAPPDMPEWAELGKMKAERISIAKEMHANYGVYSVAMRNGKLSLDQIEELAGIHKPKDFDERVEAFGRLSTTVRNAWNEIKKTHPGAASRMHPDWAKFDAMRLEREEAAYRLTTEDGGRDAHRRWAKDVGVSWKLVEDQAQKHVETLAAREIAQTPEGAVAFSYAAAKREVGAAYAQAKEAGGRIDADPAYISARDARDQAVLALAEKLRDAGIDPTKLSDELVKSDAFAKAFGAAKVTPEGFSKDLASAELRVLANTPEAILVKEYLEAQRGAGIYMTMHKEMYGDQPVTGATRKGLTEHPRYAEFDGARNRRNAAALEIGKDQDRYQRYLDAAGITEKKLAADIKSARDNVRDEQTPAASTGDKMQARGRGQPHTAPTLGVSSTASSPAPRAVRPDVLAEAGDAVRLRDNDKFVASDRLRAAMTRVLLSGDMGDDRQTADAHGKLLRDMMAKADAKDITKALDGLAGDHLAQQRPKLFADLRASIGKMMAPSRQQELDQLKAKVRARTVPDRGGGVDR